MKTFIKQNEKGIAIVFALGVISLLLVIGVGFLTNAIIEKKTESSFNSLATARMTADSGLNRVMTGMKACNSNTSLVNFGNIYSHTANDNGNLKNYEDLQCLIESVKDNNGNPYYSWPEQYDPTSEESVTWEYIPPWHGSDTPILGRLAYVAIDIPQTVYCLFGEKLDLSASVDSGFNANSNNKYAISENYPSSEATSIDINGNTVIGRPGRNISELFLSTLSFVDKTDTATKLSVTNANPAGLLQYGQHWGSLSNICTIFKEAENPIEDKTIYADNCIFDGIPIPEAFAYEDSYDVRTGSGLYHRFNLTRTDWNSLSVNDIIESNGNLKEYSGSDNGNIGKCIPWIANWKTAGDFTSADICRKQIAANLIDYSDSNNTSTTDNANNPSYVGLEKCPYINEIKLKIEGSVTESTSDVFIGGNLKISDNNNSLPGGHVNGNIEFSSQWLQNNTTNGQTINYCGQLTNFLTDRNPNFNTSKVTASQTIGAKPEEPEEPEEPAAINISNPNDLPSLTDINLNYYKEQAQTTNSYFTKNITIYESGNNIEVKIGKKNYVTVPNNNIIYCTSKITVSGKNFDRKVTLISSGSNVIFNNDSADIEPADNANDLSVYAGRTVTINGKNCRLGGNVRAKSSITLSKENTTVDGYVYTDKNITFDGWSSGGPISTGPIQCDNLTINSTSNTVNGNIKLSGDLKIYGNGSNTINGAVQTQGLLLIDYDASNNIFKGDVDIYGSVTVNSKGNIFDNLLISRNGNIKLQGWTGKGENIIKGNIKCSGSFTVDAPLNTINGSVQAGGNIKITTSNNSFNSSIQGENTFIIDYGAAENSISGSVNCKSTITVAGESNIIEGVAFSREGQVIIKGDSGKNTINTVRAKGIARINWSPGNIITGTMWSDDDVIIENKGSTSETINQVNTIRSGGDTNIYNSGLKVSNIIWSNEDIYIPYNSTHSLNKLCATKSITIQQSVINDCSEVWSGEDITLKWSTQLNTSSLNCGGSLIIDNNNSIASSDSTTYTANVSVAGIDLELVNMYETSNTCNAELTIGGTYKWILGENETLVNYSATANMNSIAAGAEKYTISELNGVLNISPQYTQTGEPGLAKSITDFKITSLKVKLTDTSEGLFDYSFIEPSTDYTTPSSYIAYNSNDNLESLLFIYPVYAKSANAEAIQTARDAADTASKASAKAKDAAAEAEAAKDLAIEAASNGDATTAIAAAETAVSAATEAAEASTEASDAAAEAAEAAEIATGNSATFYAEAATVDAQEATVYADNAQAAADIAEETAEAAANNDLSQRILSADGSVGELYFDYQIADPRQNLNLADWNGAKISKSANIGTIGLNNTDWAPGTGNDTDKDPEPNAEQPWLLSTAFIRNAPMLSPWELGFIHRGTAWQTINLKKYNSTEGYNGGGNSYSDGDANILDQIKMSSNTQTYGKVNINSGLQEVLKTLFAKIRFGSDIASSNGPGEIESSTEISDSAIETFTQSLIAINGEGTDSSKQFFTRAEVLSNSSLANWFTGFGSTDALKEEVIGKYINLSTALKQLPDEFKVIVVAQAIKDLSGTVKGVQCEKGIYDVGGDLILATQKILATVRRNPVNNKFYITDLEYIE